MNCIKNYFLVIIMCISSVAAYAMEHEIQVKLEPIVLVGKKRIKGEVDSSLYYEFLKNMGKATAQEEKRKRRLREMNRQLWLQESQTIDYFIKRYKEKMKSSTH